MNIIGPSVYVKSSADSAAMLAEKIGLAVKEGEINLREICPGDTLGRISEGLSQGRIYSGTCSWATKPPEKRWSEVPVAYVYSAEPGRLSEQAAKNSTKVLAQAGLIFPGQFVGLKELTVVVGNTKEDVVSYIQGKEIKVL